jgi:hypothetical protein
MFIVIVSLDINVPAIPPLCVIEETSELFTVAVSQFSAIVSFVYFREPNIKKYFSRLTVYY